jgi:hypothetical protein
MPVYEYECAHCGRTDDKINSVETRHSAAPTCHGWMQLVISPVRGIVRFPAAGGREYTSPVTGKPITTEKARRDDLARSGCRPYEGFATEFKEAQKVRAAEDKKADAKLHESVARAYHQLSPEKRHQLEAA